MLRFPDCELPADHPDRGRLDAIARDLETPARRIALAGSLDEYIADALSMSPCVEDAPRQQALTRTHLEPAIPALERLLLDLRADLDPVIRQQPRPGAKAYPLGWCREITEAVQSRLAHLGPAEVPSASAQGLVALRRFLAAGGRMRGAWGDLRGRYFQNAMIVGSLYVDVANDSVVVTKPPVEILPFADAGFRPIADFGHFARIAERYWGDRFLPNHLLPELAPYFPWIQIQPSGAVRLGSASRYLIALNLRGRFAPSEQALAAPPLPEAIFAGLRNVFSDGRFALSADAHAGRESALAACRAYRSEARDRSAAALNTAVISRLKADQRLARVVVTPAAA